MYSSRYVMVLISVLFISIRTSCSSSTDTHLILATATTGGTYYPVGVGIAMLTSTTLDSLSMTAITSAGSGENIQLLKNREADLAILQGLYGAMAWQGKGIYSGKPEKDIRSVTMLWQNVEHFVILSKYAETGNISDLKNLRNMNFSIGRRGSGTEISGRVIALACGFDPDEDFNLQYLGYTSSAQALQDGRISGMNIPAGPPASSISQAAAIAHLCVLTRRILCVHCKHGRFHVQSSEYSPAYCCLSQHCRTILAAKSFDKLCGASAADSGRDLQ